eukprot:115819-Amphidinium_carterae.1
MKNVKKGTPDETKKRPRQDPTTSTTVDSIFEFGPSMLSEIGRVNAESPSADALVAWEHPMVFTKHACSGGNGSIPSNFSTAMDFN